MDNFEVFGIPAVKSNSIIHAGRPSSGLAIFYSKQLSKFVTHVEVPNSSRVHAIKVKLPTDTYVFINCYFPTDPKVNNFDDSELLNTLQDITYIIDSSEPGSKYIYMGDLNADFSRNTAFVHIVENFVNEKDMTNIWNKFPCDFTYCQTQTRDNALNTYFSLIDHFFVSANLLDDCVEATAIHLAENTSNHDPIYLKFTCESTASHGDTCDENVVRQPKPAWNKAKSRDIVSYKNDLSELLSHICTPNVALSCRDPHCGNAMHTSELDKYAINIMNTINAAVDRNIPTTSSSEHKKFPGWTDHVKPFKNEADFWHSVWLSAGRPQNNSLHIIMKKTKNQYHYAIRRIKLSEKSIRNEKFVQDCESGNVNNILKDIKNMRQQKHSSNVIDGKSGNPIVAEHFKEIYNTLYNTHDDRDEVNDLHHNVSDSIKESDMVELNKINPSFITNIINKMKVGKNDVNYDFRSNALKHGAVSLAPHLSNLLKSFFIHGHVTDLFLKCAMVPIIKDKNGSHTSSSNYRAIAISSLIVKLIDYTFLELHSPAFLTSNQQFGFIANSSTTLCSWAVSETVNYFTNRGSAVYVCFLDLKKAFDTVKLSTLFHKLNDRLPPIFLRLLMQCYKNQECYVRWNNCASSTFQSSNGVRQGASTSPALFSVYIDDLFHELKQSGLGCYIDDLFFGAYGYADDIALVSPDRKGLQKMLDICVKFFDKHGIQVSYDVNPKKSKTKCISFNLKDTIPMNITINNTPLPWVDTYKHLGHIIHKDESWCHDMLIKRGEFIGKVHSLRQELGGQSPEVFIKLVTIYLTSFYGSSLWDLFSRDTEKLWSTWNTMIRTTFNLPYATHRYIINALCNGTHLKIKLLSRFIKFHGKISSCKKPEIKLLLSKQINDYRSSFGRNCQRLCQLTNASSVNTANIHDIHIYPVPTGEEWKIDMIKELMGNSMVTNLSVGEVKTILNYVCCS